MFGGAFILRDGLSRMDTAPWSPCIPFLEKTSHFWGVTSLDYCTCGLTSPTFMYFGLVKGREVCFTSPQARLVDFT
jgi:hypothetical protein